MTIASEITRLQWAKASARTSIINKWVDVPSSAKVDTYHTYIDQISTWVPQEDYDALMWVVDGITLANHLVTSYNVEPRVYWNVSFYQDWVAYWCTLNSDRYDDYYYRLTGYRKKKWSDIEYADGSSSYYSWSIFTMIEQYQYWINSTSIRAFFTIGSSLITNPYRFFQVDWNYKNFSTPVVTEKASWNTSDISAYSPDTTWYTQITTSAWVKNVWTRRVSQQWWVIYLVLWEPAS